MSGSLPYLVAAAASLGLALALAPVTLRIRWRTSLRSAHLRAAFRARASYLLFAVRARGALGAALLPPEWALRLRLAGQLGPLVFGSRTLRRPAAGPARGRPTAPGGSAPSGASRRAAGAMARVLHGRAAARRVVVSARVGAGDAMATALAAASTRALVHALAARLVPSAFARSPAPRVEVTPAFGRAGVEARGEVVAQVRAWVLALAAAGAAAAALRGGGATGAGAPQRARAQRAAA